MATATRRGAPSGLTTTRAAFIEQAKSRGELFIHQPYELYSDENQETWRRLYAAIAPKWRRYAHPRFLQGVASSPTARASSARRSESMRACMARI